MKKIESLYIHFPFCSHLCNYCDFYKQVPENKTKDYSSYYQFLESSFKIHDQLMSKHGYKLAPLKSVYIGGGTPSLWGEEGAGKIKTLFQENNIVLSKDCEFTLEVNPKAWTEGTIKKWSQIGVNRYSVGIQTINSELIKKLDRSHGLEDIIETLTFFKNKKLNYSIDVMLGLPDSELCKRDIFYELQTLLSYNPSHFSVYILTVKDNYKHFNTLPNEEYIEKEYLDVSAFMLNNHFEHYEVSNFALKDKKSFHNLRYWNSDSVAALGPSATGFLKEVGVRYKWKTKTPDFELEVLSEEQIKIEQLYMKLRSDLGLVISEWPSLQKVADNLVIKNMGYVKDGILRLNSRGFLVLDSVMDEIFHNKIV